MWAWLGGIGGKILGALLLVAGVVGAKAIYDRNRRREGAREVTDQLDKQGAAREDAMKKAPKAETDDEMDKILRDGRA
jgi:hypothetical protein